MKQETSLPMTSKGTNQELIAKLEALLFIYGEPMPIKKLAATLGAPEDAVRQAAEALRQECGGTQRGLSLLAHEGALQMVTKPEFSSLFDRVVKEEFAENLTPASFEALTIIAYAGSATRAEVDYIRGVNSSFIIRSLLLRGLIERKDERRGHFYVYGPSFELLRHCGVSRIEELPEYEKFHPLARMMRDGS